MENTHQMPRKISDSFFVYLAILSSWISFMLIYFALSIYEFNITISSLLFALVAVCFVLFTISVFLIFKRKKDAWKNVSAKIRKNTVLMAIETSLILLFGGTAIIFISPFMNEVHYLMELNYIHFLIAVSSFVIVFALPTSLLLALFGKKEKHGQIQ